MNEAIFEQMDFGPLAEFLADDDITDISYSNNGQVWLKTLSKGVYQVERPDINNTFMEKLAFQCSNVMGKTFNMAHPLLDAESAELRMNFIHESIATNGIACLIRKTPAKIRLNKEKLLNEEYITETLHDFLMNCVAGHCNIIVAGETGSGKTELLKYLASHIKENEKIITIEDTLELHLDRIFPHRDIVAMKTNNICSYTDVLVACMRQNPIWILLSEVRSGEAVMSVRNAISSGHNILSTIHADKASSIPLRMYSLMESSQDVEQFLNTIQRYVQIGVYVKGYFSKKFNRFQREIIEGISKDYFSVLLVELDQGQIYSYREAGSNGKRIADFCRSYHDRWTELLPAYAKDLVSDASRENFLEELSFEKLKSTNEDYSFTYEYMSDEGVLYYQARVSYVKKKDRTRAVVIGTRDIDDLIQKERLQKEQLRKAYIQAENASKAKTDFLNSMSHDIRTPMNVILGYNQLMKKKLTDPVLVDYQKKMNI